MIIGVIGCMAERDHDGIRARLPYVDSVRARESRPVSGLAHEVARTRRQGRWRSNTIIAQGAGSPQRTLLYDSSKHWTSRARGDLGK